MNRSKLLSLAARSFGLLVVATAPALPSPLTASALSSEAHDVRFAVMGNRERDGTISGETVPVYVPWEGVNVDPTTVGCLVGEIRLHSNGDEEHLIIGTDGSVALQLRLSSAEDGTWEVKESSGRCETLAGSGSFRRTSWADGSVSYRFIGAARLETEPGA